MKWDLQSLTGSADEANFTLSLYSIPWPHH